MDPDREGGSRIEISDLVAALKALAPETEPSGPSPQQADAIHQRISSGFMPPTEMAEFALGASVDDIDLSPLFDKHPTRTAVPNPPNKKGALRIAALGLLAFTIAATALVTSAMRAPADGALRPVRLKIEAIQLAISSSDVSRARLFLDIAASRADELDEIGLAHRSSGRVADEMAAASLGSLQILERIGANGETIDVIARLYGQALAAELLLAQPGGDGLDPTRQTMRSIAARARLLLDGPAPVVDAQPEQLVTSSDDVTKARNRRVAEQHSGAPVQAQQPSEAAPPAPGGGGTAPTCDASAGDICLHAPDLPVTPPGA